MNAFQRALITCLFCAILAIVWLGRYDLQPVGRGEGAATGYVLDRWTGDVLYLHHTSIVPTKSEP